MRFNHPNSSTQVVGSSMLIDNLMRRSYTGYIGDGEADGKAKDPSAYLLNLPKNETAVNNLSVLTAAEQRIKDLEYIANGDGDVTDEEQTPDQTTPTEEKALPMPLVIGVCGGFAAVLLLAVVFAILYLRARRALKSASQTDKVLTTAPENDRSGNEADGNDESRTEEDDDNA